MRPNLARFHATSLDFCCDLELEPAEFEGLTSAFPDDKNYRELPWIFANSYTVGRARYFASAVVMPAKGKATALHVHFEFSRRRLSPPDPELRPLSDFLSLVSEQESERKFDCTVALEYPDKGWGSLVLLPMRLLEYSGLPFDEFRGFRAVKIEEGKTAYSIIIDRPENKAISHAVQFSHSSRIEASLADTILAQAVRISSLFIRPEEG
ncbi:MAG: hypothetical protein Q8P22_07000 [Chloroflexota bacterium]|nr:hypothetical protein [Chloroflexota bacterium]